MGNEDSLSTDPVLINTHETDETVSNVCNNLYENVRLAFLQTKKLENPKNITIGHLNVNSLRNKFISINELSKSKLHIFLVSETKIDQGFPNQQFPIDGYKTYCKKFGGGLLLDLNEYIPCRELATEQIDSNFEIIFLEITLQTRKWLVIGLYKPPNQKEEYFL